MTVHTVSAKDPARVIRADSYKLRYTVVLEPDDPKLAELEQNIQPEHRRPDGYGLGFYESEEHSVLYIGPAQQILDVQAADKAGQPSQIDGSRGAYYEKWPSSQAWEDFIPAKPWNAAGEGIVTEFDHPLGGKVVVYEYLWDAGNGEQHTMVTFHCERCHLDTRSKTYESRWPDDRREVGRFARLHLLHANQNCRPMDPAIAETATAFINERYGTNQPVITWDSRCALEGPCAQIRRFRAARG